MTKAIDDEDREIDAIRAVHSALKGLEPDAQARVLSYVGNKLKIQLSTPDVDLPFRRADRENESPDDTERPIKHEAEDELESVSPAGKKWILRNGFQEKQLSKIFSLSDEIDLIVKSVPGTSKKERMRSVFLLKGLAAYLATGAARFSHSQIKEACLHYDAFDAANFATYLKSLSGEVSGNKDTEYALTPRGMNGATETVKKLLQPG